MNDLPQYTPLPKKPETDPVARSIAKPDAFSRAGTMKGQTKGMRFRPLKTTVRRRRRHDRRDVQFF